jgi:hypothetical protein
MTDLEAETDYAKFVFERDKKNIDPKANVQQSVAPSTNPEDYATGIGGGQQSTIPPTANTTKALSFRAKRGISLKFTGQ